MIIIIIIMLYYLLSGKRISFSNLNTPSIFSQSDIINANAFLTATIIKVTVYKKRHVEFLIGKRSEF